MIGPKELEYTVKYLVGGGWVLVKDLIFCLIIYLFKLKITFSKRCLDLIRLENY